jgi:hypothetical protein
MDLTRQPPRSPYERLGGYVWLPRLIDKARAYAAGTLGDYHYVDCPMNAHLLHFLGIDSDRMASVIAERPTDEQVWHWVDAHAIPHSLPIRELFNQRFMRFKGENPAEHQLYREMIDRLAFGQRIDGFFDLLDLDDGRPLSQGRAKAA